jgi:hypothetical protein
MQFLEGKRNFRVLSYRGYDKEKRHAIVKKIGTIDNYDYTFKPDEECPPTEEEMSEIEAFIKEKKDKQEQRSAEWAIYGFKSTISRYSSLIDESPERVKGQDIPAILAALDELKTKLKALVKPAQAKGKTAKKTAAAAAKKVKGKRK